MGIANGNTQCDLFNGTCECRDNIEGRACDVCTHGYYNFPHCQQCSCHKPGTELEVCDKVDGTCFCKKNAVGRDCEENSAPSVLPATTTTPNVYVSFLKINFLN